MSIDHREPFHKVFVLATTEQQLIAQEAQLEREILEIQGKLAQSWDRKKAGEEVDPAWVRRAKFALRNKKQQLKQVHVALEEQKRQRAQSEKNRRSFSHQFLMAAKQMLDRETYERISEITNQRLDLLKGDSSAG